MMNFVGLNCQNYEELLEVLIKDLFFIEEYIYVAICGMVEVSLNIDRHWCDGFIYEVVLVPLVGILESRERCIKLMEGLMKGVNGDVVAEAIFEL